ncbi:hypothetical protein BGZ83_010775 [Gryganskiella cystojenkinii]|nr:hypothetical protein BGZ83_010775 [Gryganskiella cystojenkinii]
MRFSIIAAAAALFSAVAADQAFITAPVLKTVWKAGSTVTLTWSLNKTAPGSDAALAVVLFHGTDPQHQTQVAALGSSTAGANNFKTILPATLDSDWYSVHVGDSWSSYFIIQGAGPIPTGNPPSVTTTVAPIATSTTAALPTVTVNTTTPAAPTQTKGSGASMLTVAPAAMAAVAAVAAALAF